MLVPHGRNPGGNAESVRQFLLGVATKCPQRADTILNFYAEQQQLTRHRERTQNQLSATREEFERLY